MRTHSYPAWFYGPGGASKVFNSEAEVPAGWHDHPSKAKGEAPAPTTGKGHTSVQPGAEAGKPQTQPVPGANAEKAPPVAGGAGPAAISANVPANVPEPGTGVDPSTIDAEGYAFDPELHAATRSITKGGLWRMKVGVVRPAPKQPLDL